LFQSFPNQKELEQRAREIAEEIDEETLCEIIRELYGRKIQTFYHRLLGCLLRLAEEKLMLMEETITFEKYCMDVIKIREGKSVPEEIYKYKNIVMNWDAIKEAVEKENKDIYALTISNLSEYLPKKNAKKKSN
jgi:hypothetical protein